MTDCVLIQNGKAGQIFAGTSKQALCYRAHDDEETSRAIFPQAIIDAIVEVASDSVVIGADWNGEVFANPVPIVVRRLVPKRLIVDRLQAIALLAAARAALDAADLYTQERWNTRESIYADDETAIGLLTAIGADPEAILAAE